MNPNDPNDSNYQDNTGQAPTGRNPNDPSAADLTPDVLYGPSTPGVDDQLPAANQPEAPANEQIASYDQTADQQTDQPTLDYPQEAYNQESVPEPATDAQEFYNDIAPDATGENYAGDFATEGIEQGQYEENAYQDPAPQAETPPPIPPENNAMAAAPGALPPIPGRSKKPLLIIGILVAVVILIGAGVAVFAMSGNGGQKTCANGTCESPLPSSDEDDPCLEDPTLPGCEDAEPSPDDSEPTDEPTVIPSPAASPRRSITPQQCNLLGVC